MSEQKLRKALGAMNHLEPPRDDLFVERAMSRGRARAHRRRSGLMGAAAALVVVGGVVGGTWLAGGPISGDSTASGALAPGTVSAQTNGAHAGGVPTPAVPQPENATPGMPPARDLSGWFSGPMTPARVAMESLAPTLEARFPDVFGGTYAADAGNTRIVLCVTRSDADLEALVQSSMPAGSVEYLTVAHSARQLRQVAARIEAARIELQAKGVTVLSTTVDAKTNRVVVTTMGTDHGAVAALVGPDLVTVVVDTSHTPHPMFPGGSTHGPVRN